MIFDTFFDRVAIVSLPDKKDRVDRLLNELKDKGLCENPVVYNAIHGDTVGVSSWWKWGGGAWGCLLSHMRILEDFCMDFGYRQQGFINKKLLVLEDDTIFSDNAKEEFEKFTLELPLAWDQFYLGGQHTQKPEIISENLIRCTSVNRTHAYAVQGRCAPFMYRHITYFHDYDPRHTNHHIDHQLEIAHRRGDWSVMAPKKWIAGQGENSSDINGQYHPDKWWDWDFNEDKWKVKPIINKSKDPNYSMEAGYHYGYNLVGEGLTDKFLLSGDKDMAQYSNFVTAIMNEAWDRRATPAFCTSNPEHIKKISLCCKTKPMIV